MPTHHAAGSESVATAQRPCLWTENNPYYSHPQVLYTPEDEEEVYETTVSGKFDLKGSMEDKGDQDRIVTLKRHLLDFPSMRRRIYNKND